MAAGPGEPYLGLKIQEQPPPDGDEFYLKLYVDRFGFNMVRHFEVVPAIFWYDDNNQPPSGNAMAITTNSFSSLLDGTILLGIHLFKNEIYGELKMWEKVRKFGSDALPPPLPISPLVIMAHEFGHIVQFKRGMDLPVHVMELHADFMAGWYMSRWPSNVVVWKGFEGNKAPPEKIVADSVRTLFEKGDYEFNNPDHHGTPEQRVAMVHAGFEAGALDVSDAFEEGKKRAANPPPAWPP